MRRKRGSLPDHEAHVARLAWWAAFLATIALVAILSMARSAQASRLPVAADPGSAPAAPPFDRGPQR
jgi:hypothetical protein